MLIQRIIQCIVSTAAAAAILFFLGCEFFQSSTTDFGAAIFLMFLGGAALSPIVVWWIFSFIIKSAVGRYVLLAVSTALFGFGAFGYGSHDIHKDALNGLLFLIIPFWQVAALTLLFGGIYFVEYRNRRHDTA
jgi:hypothetical protein